MPNNNISVVGVTSHHLFDHKPDNLLSKGGGNKYNLYGYYRYGTPGIAVVFGEHHNIENYINSMKDAMPQKKFDVSFSLNPPCPDAVLEKVQGIWTEVSDLGELRQVLTNLGLEECFFQVTGLDPSKATTTTTSSSTSNNNEKGGKGGKGKKKKK